MGKLACLVPVEVVDPGVSVGTLPLARSPLPLVPLKKGESVIWLLKSLGHLVFQLAGALLPAAATRPVGEVAVEDWRRVNLGREKGVLEND